MRGIDIKAIMMKMIKRKGIQYEFMYVHILVSVLLTKLLKATNTAHCIPITHSRGLPSSFYSGFTF